MRESQAPPHSASPQGAALKLEAVRLPSYNRTIANNTSLKCGG
jgi:hypothetical protein